MSELDEKPAGNRWPLVLGCAAVAAVYSLATVEKLGAWIAGAAGGAFALLVLPTIAALLSARATDQWHRVFAWCFAVVFALAVVGSVITR